MRCALANTRREEFLAYEDIEVPNRITARAPVYLNMPAAEVEVAPSDKDARVLYGMGATRGRQAECKVIRSPQDELDLNGRILTAVRTDQLGAALPDLLWDSDRARLNLALGRGREKLGIQRLGGKHLLSIVTDGERVRIDGERGTATRVSPMKAHMKVETTDGLSGVPHGFCELAQAIYQGDDQWIPEDPQAITSAFSPENAGFKKGVRRSSHRRQSPSSGSSGPKVALRWSSMA